jgi:hypothetical protein
VQVTIEVSDVTHTEVYLHTKNEFLSWLSYHAVCSCTLNDIYKPIVFLNYKIMFHYKCLLHNTLIIYFTSHRTSCHLLLTGFYRWEINVNKARNSTTLFL